MGKVRVVESQGCASTKDVYFTTIKDMENDDTCGNCGYTFKLGEAQIFDGDEWVSLSCDCGDRDFLTAEEIFDIQEQEFAAKISFHNDYVDQLERESVKFSEGKMAMLLRERDRLDKEINRLR